MAEDHSIMEGEYVPALVETVRVMNVNLNDWSVDCVSEFGYKRYFDIQIMSPYFHFNNGEGLYVVPEAGALAWLCRPSGGKFGAPFLMGFQAPYDEDNASFRSGRQTLNPGDIMLRTRDENFMVLRRGGVVQIGATPVAQRMYIPLQNFIKDFCQNYQLATFGGTMLWETVRTDQSKEEEAQTKLSWKVKSHSNEPDHVLELSMGGHGDDDPLKLSLQVYTDGTDDRELMADLKITNEGDVTWDVENNFSVTAKTDINFKTEEGNFNVDAEKDVNVVSLDGNMTLEAAKEFVARGVNKATLVSDTETEIEAAMIKLGSGASSEPAVLGLALTQILTKMISQIATFQFVAPLIPSSPAPVIAAPAISSISGDLANMVSKKTFVE